MLTKVLGVIDILIAIVFLLLSTHFLIPKFLLIACALILFIKGIPAFSLDIASMFDIFAAILLFLSTLFVIPGILLIIACFLLIQKGALSLL